MVTQVTITNTPHISLPKNNDPSCFLAQLTEKFVEFFYKTQLTKS